MSSLCGDYFDSLVYSGIIFPMIEKRIFATADAYKSSIGKTLADNGVYKEELYIRLGLYDRMGLEPLHQYSEKFRKFIREKSKPLYEPEKGRFSYITYELDAIDQTIIFPKRAEYVILEKASLDDLLKSVKAEVERGLNNVIVLNENALNYLPLKDFVIGKEGDEVYVSLDKIRETMERHNF